MTNSECIFCNPYDTRINTLILENEYAFSRWDNFPVSEGHAEIIPKRHVASFFDLKDAEVLAIYKLAEETEEIIMTKYSPDGYNIGINEGEAAGRSVHHLHMHLIPRYVGDVPEPRGGVRHIIPGKGSY